MSSATGQSLFTSCESRDKGELISTIYIHTTTPNINLRVKYRTRITSAFFRWAGVILPAQLISPLHLYVNYLLAEFNRKKNCYLSEKGYVTGSNCIHI